MAQIAYWIAHPDSTWPGTPTGAQIAAGNLSSGSPASYSGSESAPGSGSGTITEATAVTGLTASTAYRIAWVVYDDVALTYSNVVVGTESTLSAAIEGDLTQALADADLSSSGTLLIQGSTDATLEGASLSATGALGIAGTLSATLEDATLAAEGAGVQVNTGTLTATLGDMTCAATGGVDIAAELGVTLGDLALNAEADLALTGELIATLANATLSAQGGTSLRFVTLRLLDKAQSGTSLPGLTGIKWAFYESLNPATWGAPVDQGDAESTDGNGVITFEFPSTALGAGDVGMLAATISDGDPAQSPVPRSFLVPVTLE